MSESEKISKPKTALQKLKASQKKALSQLPRKSPKRATIKAKYEQQVAALKHDQNILARARATLTPKQRKKLKPVRYLSPSTIKKETHKISEQGHKLRKPKVEVRPPYEGRTTKKCFRMPREEKQLRTFLNKIFVRYQNGGGLGKADIRGWRAIVTLQNGQVVSTGIMDPDYQDVNVAMMVMGEIQFSDPTVNFKDAMPKEICIIISWNYGYASTPPHPRKRK